MLYEKQEEGVVGDGSRRCRQKIVIAFGKQAMSILGSEKQGRISMALWEQSHIAMRCDKPAETVGNINFGFWEAGRNSWQY